MKKKHEKPSIQNEKSEKLNWKTEVKMGKSEK